MENTHFQTLVPVFNCLFMFSTPQTHFLIETPTPIHLWPFPTTLNCFWWCKHISECLHPIHIILLIFDCSSHLAPHSRILMHSHPSATVPNHSQLFLMVQTHFQMFAPNFESYCSFSTILATQNCVYAFSSILIHLQLFPSLTMTCFSVSPLTVNCYDFRRLRQSSTVVVSKVWSQMSLEECKSWTCIVLLGLRAKVQVKGLSIKD